MRTDRLILPLSAFLVRAQDFSGFSSVHDNDAVILALVSMLARALIGGAVVPGSCLGEAGELQNCNTLDTAALPDFTPPKLGEEFDPMANQRFRRLLRIELDLLGISGAQAREDDISRH